MDRFGEIVFDLGEELELPLRVDGNGACRINIPDAFAIQMQMDPMHEKLFFVAQIAEIPPGNYRKELIFATLRSNSRRDVPGYLTYLSKKAALLLCDTMASEEINTAKLIEKLETLIDRGKEWKDAIASGQVAPQEELRRFSASAGVAGPMFGMR